MEKDWRAVAPRLMNLRLKTGLMTATLIAICAVVYRFSPSEHSFYPRCPLYAMTHLLCPGCGSTRALYSLLHGQWHEALQYNAMFTVLMPVALAWGIFCVYHVMRYDRLLCIAIPRGTAVGIGVVVLLFTVARNTLFIF